MRHPRDLGTRLVLLGTKGGPRPRRGTAGPSQVILVGDRPVLIDCGEGVVQRLLEARIDPGMVRDVLITHHHCDHNVALGNVLMANWTSGGAQPIRVAGPPPLETMVGHLLAANAYDIDTRVADEGRVDLRELVTCREVVAAGVIHADEGLRITVALVDHPPVEPALAYRIDTPDGSVVVSGDTAPCEAVVALARGADVLVHEVIHTQSLSSGRHPRANTRWDDLHAHLTRSHTPVEEVGRIAARADVGALVLSHLVPSTASLPDAAWTDPVRKSYRGPVIVGRDLMEITMGGEIVV